jgi:hypothetical protein
MPSTVQVWPRPEKKPLIAVITSIGNPENARQRRYLTSSSCKADVCPPSAIKVGAAGTTNKKSSPMTTAKWMPCQTAGPTRCGRPAPVYCATKVEV